MRSGEDACLAPQFRFVLGYGLDPPNQPDVLGFLVAVDIVVHLFTFERQTDKRSPVDFHLSDGACLFGDLANTNVAPALEIRREDITNVKAANCPRPLWALPSGY